MFTIPKTSRRTFIRTALASAPFGMLPAMAQSATDYKALVCIFLLGGNDSNNTIVPMDDRVTAYRSLRGALALQASTGTPSATTLSQTVQDTAGVPYAFHSQLSALASLFSSRELAVVANVGPLVEPLTRDQYIAKQSQLPSNLFSHSDQIALWQSSIAQGQSPTGWGGRLADQVLAKQMNASSFAPFLSVAGGSLMGTGAQTTAIAMTPGQSLQLNGYTAAASSQARWKSVFDLLVFDTGISLVQSANIVMANSVNQSGTLATALAKAPAMTTVFPTTSLGNQLKQVAQIIQVQRDLGMNRQIFFATLGGFDTHAGQINTQNNLYGQLGPALAAFYSATQEIGQAANVTTFTESDFSRTFQSTSGDGSDHAWGSNQIVLGGAVKGGNIYGKFPAFQLSGPDDADSRGRWIPTTSVDQFGATLASWFGVNDPVALAQVFPNLKNFAAPNLGFFAS